MLHAIAIIPDGTRRYAKKHGIALNEAYEKGFDKVEEVLDWFLEQGEVKEATFWGLSTENAYNRPREELGLLNELYKVHLEELLENKKIFNNKVRVRIIGDRGVFQDDLRAVMKRVEDATASHDKFSLNLALAYGGKSELLNAVKTASTEKPVASLTEKDIEKHLAVQTNPDLVIRTSGIQRLSGYLMWQSAYSELFFSKALWPEFSREDLQEAVDFYKNTQRNFGK